MAKTLRFLAGILFIPLICAEICAIFYLIPDAFSPSFPFISPPLLAFSCGGAAWCAIAWRFSVNNWFYVFGHELTHAAWALMTFSRVGKIKITSKGGYCIIDNPGPLTTLAPYFVPFYLVVLLILRLILGIWLDMIPYGLWWLAALGFAYAFHVTNTIESLATVSQPDIRAYGRLFSCILIITANLFFLGLGLAAMLGVPIREWLAALLSETISAYSLTWSSICTFLLAVFEVMQDFFSEFLPQK